MKKEDWTGVSISLGVHVVIILLLSFLTVAASEETPIGFMEVEFGPIADGRPVQEAPETPEPEPEPEEFEEIEETEEQPAVAPPEEAKPVELPDQAEEVIDVETIETPETEVIAPEEQKTEEEEEAPDPEPEKEVVKPLGSGALTVDEGDDSGDDGSSSEPEKSAPFQIEGLNRTERTTPLPVMVSERDVTIQVRIFVGPDGRVIRMMPVRKGDPAQERAVMEALSKWSFNALPPNVPQITQEGLVSFRFSRQ